MKLKYVKSTIFLLLIGGGGTAYFLLRPIEVEPRKLTGLVGTVQRGAYLARASGCFACHSDTKSKRPVLAGGGPLNTPFGTFYAPNITMHGRDGIGNWNLSDFSRALTVGINPKGENYYPVFLYPHYTKLSDQDIVDMWTAFKTVPPVAGKSPKHDLNFPFQYRFLLNAWKRLFFKPGRFQPDPNKSKEWNRGAFLVNGPAHCSACHTPKNILGGNKKALRFAGIAKGPGGEKIPSITGTDLKKNGWDRNSLAFSLKTGSKPDGDVFGASMGEVVRDGTRFLTDSDLKAIAEYVFSIRRQTENKK